MGNGSNDIPVFKAVGGSVALFEDPDVRKAAKAWLREPKSLGEVVDAVLAQDGVNVESSSHGPQTR